MFCLFRLITDDDIGQKTDQDFGFGQRLRGASGSSMMIHKKQVNFKYLSCTVFILIHQFVPQINFVVVKQSFNHTNGQRTFSNQFKRSDYRITSCFITVFSAETVRPRYMIKFITTVRHHVQVKCKKWYSIQCRLIVKILN